MLIKTNEVAELFGLGHTTVTRHIKAGMPVHKEEGKAKYFQGAEVHKWLIEHEISKRVGTNYNGEAIDYEYERARLTRAQAYAQELKNEQEDGHLLPAELIRFFVEENSKRIASILDSAPADIKRRLPHLKKKELDIIQSSIIKARNVAARSKLSDEKMQEAERILKNYEGKR